MNHMKDKGEGESPLDFCPEARQRNIGRLDKEAFHVLVIGGGITGAGIARDAALRGFKTALIEKDDFAAGTSSRSSKLVHGGFRYLKQLQFGLVHGALVERKTLMDLAPHLVYPIQCMLPVYWGPLAPALMIHIGMWLYDFLAFEKNIGRHRMISAGELRKVEPEYRHEGVRKAAAYYDCWADDFRLVLSTIQSAALHGAIMANYLQAVDVILEDGKTAGVLAEDRLTGEEIAIKSSVVANATGPWSDHVRQALLRQRERKVRLTKGVHLIVSREDLPIHHALMQFAIQDGRPVFAIPWENLVLLGTTDTDYDGDLDQIPSDRSDVDYLLESFNYYFPRANLTYAHILSTFAGLRPLVFEEGKPASRVSRDYQIFEGPENFFSIIGGKLTTYRVMAKQMVDRLIHRLAISSHRTVRPRPCITYRVPLFGGDIQNYEAFQIAWISRLTEDHHFDFEVAKHFVETYGSDIPAVLRAIGETPTGTEPICPGLPYVWGELTYAIDHEMTLGLDDFLVRRTHISLFEKRQGIDVCGEVADRMQRRLGWSAQEKQAQIDRYTREIKLTQHFREEMPYENEVYRQS
jgi:glycerol-3-phosphate dehydrogenase